MPSNLELPLGLLRKASVRHMNEIFWSEASTQYNVFIQTIICQTNSRTIPIFVDEDARKNQLQRTPRSISCQEQQRQQQCKAVIRSGKIMLERLYDNLESCVLEIKYKSKKRDMLSIAQHVYTAVRNSIIAQALKCYHSIDVTTVSSHLRHVKALLTLGRLVSSAEHKLSEQPMFYYQRVAYAYSYCLYWLHWPKVKMKWGQVQT